jgi:chromosomal replication initiator protein
MDEALSSRLSSGLTVDIKPPDFSTRCRILTHKARMEGLNLPPEVAEYIAERITGNVRHLESVLIHLIAKSSLLHRPLDLHLAEEVVAALHPELTQPRRPTIEEIQECVCRYFHLSRETLVSRSRKKSVYYPRQLAMYLCRQHTEATLKVIGKAFNRDHASVIHSLAVIQRKFKQDTTTRNHITFLESRILSGNPAHKWERDNGRSRRKGAMS